MDRMYHFLRGTFLSAFCGNVWRSGIAASDWSLRFLEHHFVSRSLASKHRIFHVSLRFVIPLLCIHRLLTALSALPHSHHILSTSTSTSFHDRLIDTQSLGHV